MSAKIIPVASTVEAQLLSSEDGHNCKCRSGFYKEKPSNDTVARFSVKKEAISLDLGPLLKGGAPPDAENPLSVFINCGAIPVEEKRYWDITVFNSARLRKQYQNIRVDDTVEEKGPHRHGSAFKILNLNPPILEKRQEQDAQTSCTEKKARRETRLCFRILFHPRLANVVYSEQIHLWVDSIPLKLTLRGLSIGPAVCLTRQVVNFGGIYVGNRGKRVIEMHNHSWSPARFQFIIDGMRSIFQICPTNGLIQPFSTLKIDIHFQPFAARSFYKRIFCLVHHQEPVVLDLIGICIPRPRFLPAPITFAVKIDAELALPTPTDTYALFVDGDQQWGVAFDVSRVNFGFRDPEVSHPDHSSSLPLTASNNLPYDILLEWVPDPSKVFSISPPFCIIPSNGNKIFNVNFKPIFLGTFYDATMECYVYPTDEAWDDIGPPWKQNVLSQANPIGNESTATVEPNSSVSLSELNSTAEKPAVATSLKKSSLSTPTPQATDKQPKLQERKSLTVSTKSFDHTTEIGDGDAHETGTPSQINNLSNKEVEENSKHSDEINIEEYRTENGFCMRVKMTRLNEGYDTEFKVSPVSDQLNMYELPQVVLIDEEINDLAKKNGRLSASDSSCVSNINNVVGNNKDDRQSRVNILPFDQSNLPLPKSAPESRESSEKIDGSEEGDFFPSIHPSHIILPGNDQDITHLALDGVKRVALPMCITMKVTGHTFTTQRVPFIPNVKLPLKAVMNTTMPDSPAGRTLLIKNLSDLPSVYDLEHLNILHGNLQTKPVVGFIPGNQHEIIVVRMSPTDGHKSLFKGDVGMTFNIQDNCLVGLYGYCEIPDLGIKVFCNSKHEDSEVICPITMPGCVTYTHMELQNSSGYHYKFWIEPADVEDEDWMIICPKPSRGFVGPNEAAIVSWKFSPRLDGEYYLYWRFCFDVLRTCSATAYNNSLGYYEFIIPFTGIAKTSYLFADPPLLDFDMIQMYEAKQKTVVVKNDGECPVTARFLIYHENLLANFSPEIANVHPGKVSLQGQESIELTVTVRAATTSMQHFYMIYNLEFEESQEMIEGAVMDVYEKHIADIYFMGDHPNFKFTDVIMDSHNAVWDAQQCWSMFSLNMLNGLISPQNYITPEGNNLPHVYAVPFRFPAAPINTPSYVFKLHLSNMSELSGYWELNTMPPKAWKKLSQQKLCGLCGTSEFKDGHFTDSPEFISQLWAKKFSIHPDTANKPSPTLNNRKDLELFEIFPKSGFLKSKESCNITLTYSFSTLGAHEISVLLRIFPAVYIWIDINGRTLETEEPYLQLMHKDDAPLHPISLSDIDPPTQMFWLYNGGNTSATFSVDLEPFQTLKEENFEHAVFECITAEGEVERKSWFPIKLRFSPLEYTEYSAPLKILPSYDNEPSVVMLNGSVAINMSINLRPSATLETVRKFVLVEHGIPVTLSLSHVIVDHLIPTGLSVTKEVLLTNIHAKNTMRYYWQDILIDGGGSITLDPNSGILEPNEEAVIKLIIQAGDTAIVLDTTITCTIEDDNTSKGEASSSSSSKSDSYTRLLAVSIYIGNVFGQYDNICFKEKSGIGVPPFLSCKCENDVPALTQSPLTATGSELCKSVMKDIIWDMLQSPNFESFLRVTTKREAPHFEEYADIDAIESGEDEEEEDYERMNNEVDAQLDLQGE